MITKRDLLGASLAGAVATPLIAADPALGRRPASIAGCKSLAAVGSIAAGSNRLRLRANPGFQVGDHICIETGGEASHGAPGAMGVGGAWPTLSYATTAALLADASQPKAAFAWARDSGEVYLWYDGLWKPASTSPNWHYWWKCIPRALLARIVGVAGDVLVLDATASAAAADANVYFNNSYPLSALIAANGDHRRYAFPAGTFWFAGTTDIGPNSRTVLQISKVTGLELAGAGQDVTVFRSPKGACSFEAQFLQSPGGYVHDLTFYGNFFLTSGWGFNYQHSQSRGVDLQPPDIPIAVLADTGSHGMLIKNTTFRYCSRAIASRYANRCVARNCAIHSDGILSYLQWHLYWTNSSDCWSYDCSITSKYLAPGLGCFAANDCGHFNPKLFNATVALNSTGACTIASPKIRITANSQFSADSFSSPHPIFDINQNIDQNRGRAGNKVLNMDVVQEGYINAKGDSLLGFNVSGGGRDAQCAGGRFSAPDYSGNGTRGPQAANSDLREINTMVTGLTCFGSPNPQWGNINIVNGSVTRCVAPLIVCKGPSCVATGEAPVAPMVDKHA